MITFLQIGCVHTDSTEENASRSKYNFDNRLAKQVILAKEGKKEAKEGNTCLKAPLRDEDRAELYRSRGIGLRRGCLEMVTPF